MRNYSFSEIKISKGGATRKKCDYSDSVRVGFHCNKEGRHTIFIFIGSNVLNKIGVEITQKVKVHSADENTRVLKIVKSKDDIGFTLSKNKKNTTFGKIQMTWNKFVPSDDEKSYRVVKYEVYKNKSVCELYIDITPQSLEMHL